MKKYLPRPSLTSLKESRPVVLVTTSELPRIYRFITERVVSLETLGVLKIVTIACLTAVLVLGIAYQGYMLYSNMQRIEQADATRGKLVREVGYWKEMAAQYQGYRDAYFRIASLEYALGSSAEAKTFVEKTLQLDPNFEAGYVLGAKVGISK